MGNHLVTPQELGFRLEQLAEPSYGEFSSRLTPGADNVLGVRMPHIHKLTTEILKGDFEDFLTLSGKGAFHEERMVRLLVIAKAKIDEEMRHRYIHAAVPQLSNWAECDLFCSALKKSGRDAEGTWKLIQPHLASGREFEIRFAVVMILLYLLGPEQIDRSLKVLIDTKHEGYYVKMGVAWALCEAFIKQRDKTIVLFKTEKLDQFTRSKTASKICDSRRVPATDKIMIKQILC